MDDQALTGAQRAHLRGIGQRLAPRLHFGREGATEGVRAELDRLLRAHELVKVRYPGADRHERAAAWEQVSAALRAECVGAVGHTALFFRRNANPDDHRVELPD